MTMRRQAVYAQRALSEASCPVERADMTWGSSTSEPVSHLATVQAGESQPKVELRVLSKGHVCSEDGAVRGSFIAKVRALYALGKPNLSLLVVVTSVLGFLLALSQEDSQPIRWWQVGWLAFGTALTAMGACAANMYREREIDALMKRTRTRPLPMGQVEPHEAFLYSAGVFTLGFVILWVATGAIPALLSLATLVTYAFVYTPAKLKGPISIWIGAIPGAVPPLMGWATVTGQLEPASFALFGLMFTWQFPHFLALAYMYKDDYARGGFRFLPEENCELRTGWHIGIGAVAVIISSLLPWWMGLTGGVYLVLCIGACTHFLYASLKAAVSLTPQSARGAFLASILYLPVLLLAIMLDRSLTFFL